MRHPLNTPMGRFDVQTLERGADGCVATMPVAGLLSPITGALSLGPLAILVDHAAALVNHLRRVDGEWTVTSELSLEVTPTCGAVIADHPHLPVTGTCRPIGVRTDTALSDCLLTVGDELVGTGTVRSFYIEAPTRVDDRRNEADDMVEKFGLAAKMAAGEPHRDGEAFVLPQRPDPVIDNSIGAVHGGVASAGLEVVASASVASGGPLATASLRVNFLRPFLAGEASRYVGTALRVGRRSTVAEAQAIGSDGRVAIIARLTAYRG